MFDIRTRRYIGAWIATAVALGVTIALLYQTDHPTLLASFGGSCVILFGMPESEMARPRSLFGGHLIAGAVGLTFLRFGYDRFGGPQDVWMISAVATALVLMMATRTIHSPAGANAVVIFYEQAHWTFMVWPLLVGITALYIAAVVETRLVGRDRRPSPPVGSPASSS